MFTKVRECMISNVETLGPESTMEEAVQLEMRRKIRHIPVLEDGKLVGILTDRDLKRAMPSLLTGNDREVHERVLKGTLVSQLMTKSPTTVAPDLPLRDAVRILVEKKFGALPVVEGGRLVGIITEIDLLRAYLKILDRES